MIYFELLKNKEVIARGNEILGDISVTHLLMDVATADITIPAKYIKYISNNQDIKIYLNDIVFYGIVTSHNIDGNLLNVTATHKMHEWTFRQISVNNAVKNKSLEFVYVENAQNLVYNSRTNEAIASNTLKIKQSEWEKGLSTTDLINLTKTRAWDTSPSNEGFLTVYSEIVTETTDGTKKTLIRFYTKKGTEVFVNVDVIPDENYEYTSVQIDPRIIDDLEDITKDINFAMTGWNIIYKDNSGKRLIDYVYSRMNKLEALTKTCELTEDLYWRTTLDGKLNVEIGKFGEKKEYVFSTLPEGRSNIKILDIPVVHNDYSKAVNVLSVYGDKSDSGASSLTLREIHDRPNLQNKKFPVYITRIAETNNVNNERDYSKYLAQVPIFAPNNDAEFAILDMEGIALNSGKVIYDSVGFNDIAAFNVDIGEGKTLEITDEDRILAAQTAYQAGIKWLKNNRPSIRISFNTSKLPKDLLAGDMVLFRYGYDLFCDIEISNYWEKLLKNEWWYVEEITRKYSGELETGEVVLSKFLQITRSVEK